MFKFAVIFLILSVVLNGFVTSQNYTEKPLTTDLNKLDQKPSIAAILEKLYKQQQIQAEKIKELQEKIKKLEAMACQNTLFVKDKTKIKTTSQKIVNSEKEQTWIEIDKVVYGAKPNKLGAIGGGNNYTNIITKGDYTVKDLNALLDALSKVKPGQVIFIPEETEIDLTARIYIEQLVLQVPKGVTLAGNRGYKGSRGAILTSDALKTPTMIQVIGPNVRISGLRIRGPNSKRYIEHHRHSFRSNEARGKKYYYKFPVSVGIRTAYPSLEVDNCEISAFAHGGIYLIKGEKHHIHHNFIHHCQYAGLGYGVVHNISSSLIEYNLFNWNRHSIAGTGRPGCSYIARYNIELGMSLSHCFDMHGGRDRHDGTDIAGTSIEIYNNTFGALKTPVVIRGVPEEKCEIHRNWFLEHHNSKQAVRSSNNSHVFNNVYGKVSKAVK